MSVFMESWRQQIFSAKVAAPKQKEFQMFNQNANRAGSQLLFSDLFSASRVRHCPSRSENLHIYLEIQFDQSKRSLFLAGGILNGSPKLPIVMSTFFEEVQVISSALSVISFNQTCEFKIDNSDYQFCCAMYQSLDQKQETWELNTLEYDLSESIGNTLVRTWGYFEGCMSLNVEAVETERRTQAVLCPYCWGSGEIITNLNNKEAKGSDPNKHSRDSKFVENHVIGCIPCEGKGTRFEERLINKKLHINEFRPRSGLINRDLHSRYQKIALD